MKILTRLWFALIALVSIARADEAHMKALKQVVDSMAKLDGVYVAVHGKKSPNKELETALLAEKDLLVAAASAGGVSPEVAREIQAFASVVEKTSQLMAKDTAADDVKFFRAADDLAELTRLAGRLGSSVGPASRLTAAERRELSQHVELRFGKKVVEFPRGDTSPFASGSRSPFATAMWTINLAFDDSVKR
jgi:hypothetical protein